MAVPFGFGVGDFFAVIGLIVKICQAFDDNSDILKEFREVRTELKYFEDVVDQLRKSMLGGTAISEQHAVKVKQVLERCKKVLEDFQSFIISYKGVNSARRRITWALRGKNKLEPFRQQIQRSMTVLGLVQHEVNR